MLEFLRPDLAAFAAYQPHPGGPDDPAIALDRLDTNECPYSLPDDLKDKLARTYERAIETNRYPDGSHADLKTAIAEYVCESAAAVGVEAAIAPERISVGNGSDELIRALLIATCLGDRGRVLVAEPTFSMYGILARTLGVPVVAVGRSPDFAIDLDAASAAIADPDASPVRIVWTVHPNSPTANALSPAELDWLRSLPDSILVAIDEAYFEFSGQTVVGELAARPNWIVLRTFSKAFRLAAHRVGYAIGHPDAIAVLEKVRLPYNLPAFSQAAASTALIHRRELLAAIPEIQAERDRLLAAFRDLPALTVWPSDANFIYARLAAPGADADAALADLCRQLKARGTLIRHTGGGLRITVGSPPENDRTLARLRELLGGTA